jgi:hypothetical protein
MPPGKGQAAAAPRAQPGGFARPKPVQAKAAPGRPPLAHASAAVVQRFGGNDSFDVDPVQLGLARSGGKALPPALLAKMEAAFKADFSAVRVHVGPQAARIGAIAFTTGSDLYFAPGRYQPDTVQGQQLIGHELAHVIQQRQGRVAAPGSGVSVVQDHALEAEADRLGIQAAAFRGPVQAKAAPGRGPARGQGAMVQRARAPGPPGKVFGRSRTVQRATFVTSGSWSGGWGSGGGKDDDDRPEGRWHPDDKIKKLMLIPRNKKAGGKHFVPASWIDRMLALATQNVSVSGFTNILSEMHDILGHDEPLEISNHFFTDTSDGPYATVTDSSELGLVQVFHSRREELREWQQNIFRNDIDSSGDGGGRRIDMPDAPSTLLANRLSGAARTIIQFFNTLNPQGTVQVPLQGGDQFITWAQMRALINEAIEDLESRAV